GLADPVPNGVVAVDDRATLREASVGGIGDGLEPVQAVIGIGGRLDRPVGLDLREAVAGVGVGVEIKQQRGGALALHGRLQAVRFVVDVGGDDAVGVGDRPQQVIGVVGVRRERRLALQRRGNADRREAVLAIVGVPRDEPRGIGNRLAGPVAVVGVGDG